MSRILQSVSLAFVICILAWPVGAQEQTDPYADVHKARAADGGFVLGDPDAPVKLIEFSDFLCVSCQNYEPIISGFIWDYVLTGQAQFEYRIFPVIDPELSVLSAGLVECADTLQAGKFWLAHDLMFDIVSSRGFADASVAEFANALNLDLATLNDCAAGASQHEVDAALGWRLGVSGTPSLFVQYGDGDPMPIALALPEHYPAIANAIRPASSEPVTIEHGSHAGLTTFRRADGGFVLGEPGAPLTIVAFEDFLCPHCQSYQSTIQSFIDEYVRSGVVQYEYRFYPLVNPEFSTSLATIAECVGAQDLGKFWDAHDLLFGFAANGNLEGVSDRLANLLALDAEALDACQDRSVQFLIDTQLGQNVRVSGTPAIRARDAEGNLQAVFAGDTPLERGGLSIEQLRALADGSGAVTVGPPERTLLNDNFLADTSLISGEPCAPPCWQNIVPGETSMADALAIVENMDGIGEPRVGPDRIQFGHVDAPACCQLSSGDGQTVHTILLQFAPTMRFGDAIESFGEPQFYAGVPYTDVETMMLFYFPDQSMLITVVVPGIEGYLYETSPIIGAVYSTSEALSGAIGTATLVPWQGYVRFSDYMDAQGN